MAHPTIRDVHLTLSTGIERRQGLLGYASFVLDDQIIVDGVTVRLTRDGRLFLAYPFRVGRNGRRKYAVRPVDDRARRELEHRILAEIADELEGVD